MLKIGNKVPNNIFIGDKELSKIYKGETLIFNNKSIELTSRAGEFDVTVSGFVNPVWEYNGEIQNGDTAKFTILNDNDIVTLSWDSLESDTEFTVNTVGQAKFNTKLENFRKKVTNTLELYNCSQITGDLSDLGGKITYWLNLYNCRQITGDLSDLGGKITYLIRLTLCSRITGDLSDLGGNVTYWLDLNSCSQITGDLSDLGGKITRALSLGNCSRITGIYTPVNASAVPSTFILSGTSLTASDMDATLNNISITDKKNGTFTASRMTRTSASDSAVEKLVSQGWTISGLTKVEG